MPSERPTSNPSANGHAERAARFDARELEERLRQWEADQRTTRRVIEAELRREHWGHLPEGWPSGRGR